MADPQEQLRKILADAVHSVDCGCAAGHTEDAVKFYGEIADAVLALGRFGALVNSWVFCIEIPGGSSEGTER